MTKKQTLTLISVIFLCLGLSGCGSSSTRVTPLGSGFEEVVYVRTSTSAPESHRITLQFRNEEDRQVMVWPSLMSATVVKDGVAMFVAARTYGSTKIDGIWPTTSRLFAVRGLSTPLDITDEVVGRWAQENGKDSSKYLEDPGPIEPQEKNGKIETEFVFRSFPKIVVALNWGQISNIMDVVKSSGVSHADPKWGINYIQNEFKPEATNK